MRRNSIKSSRPGLAELTITLVSLLISFLVCEFAIRHLTFGDKMGWNMVPPVETRVRDFEGAQRQRPRVLIVGDSQTEWRDSTGQSYVRVAERRLGSRNALVEFVNLAQGGTDMDSYLGNLLRYADRLEPDLIVVGLFLGNDIHGAKPPLSTPAGREQAMLVSQTPSADGSFSLKALAKKSVLLNFIFRLAKGYLPQLRSGVFEGIVQQLKESSHRDDRFVQERLAKADPILVDAARADVINPWLLASAVFYPDYYAELAAVAPGTEAESRLESALNDFAAITDFCRGRGVPIVAVLIPPPVWVSERYQRFFHQLGHEHLGPVNGKVPLIDRINVALAQFGVPTIDVLADLRSTSEETYLTNDDHLNRRGHEVVGTALARWLTSSEALWKQGRPR